MGFSLLKTFFQVIVSLLSSFKWVLIPIIIFIAIWLIDLFYVKLRFFKGCKREVIGHVNIVPRASIFEQLFVQLPRQFWKNRNFT